MECLCHSPHVTGTVQRSRSPRTGTAVGNTAHCFPRPIIAQELLRGNTEANFGGIWHDGRRSGDGGYQEKRRPGWMPASGFRVESGSLGPLGMLGMPGFGLRCQRFVWMDWAF